MLVVMENHATPDQIERVVRVIEEMGYHARPMPGGQRMAVGLVGNDDTPMYLDQSRDSASLEADFTAHVRREMRSRAQAENWPRALRGELSTRIRAYLPSELSDKIRVGRRVRSERRRVTVLFADLSGYTALCEQLDPEEVSAFSGDV